MDHQTKSAVTISLSVGLLLGACSDSGPRRSTEATRALLTTCPADLRVSANNLEQNKVGADLKTACTAEQCMMLWHQSVGPYTTLMASRIATDGAMLDVPPRRIALTNAGTIQSSLASLGANFVAAWRIANDTDPAANGVRVVRISASDGALLDAATAALIPEDGASLLGVWGIGGVTAILRGATTGWTVERVKNGERLSPAVTIPSSFGSPTIIPGSNQFLVAHYPNAFRVDATTGAVLDTTQVVFSKFETTVDANHIAGFFSDGAYALFWVGARTDLRVARIRGSDGVLMDPWDAFNEVPGSRQVLYQTGINTLTSFSAAPLADGSGAIILWSIPYIHGVDQIRVDSTGARVDAAATALPAELATTGDSSVIALSSRGGLWGSYTLTFGANGLPVVGVPVTVGSSAAPQSSPLVASNGLDFLALWAEPSRTQIGLSPSAGFASRIDGRTGAYLDSPPIQLGELKGDTPNMAVASDGSGYLVTWTEATSAAIRYMRIAADGTTTTPATIPNTDFASGELTAASDGARFMIAWKYDKVVGVRLAAADLTVLDSTPLVIRAGPFASGWEPSSLVLTANSAPAPDLRTFLAGYKLPDGVTAQRIRSAAGNVLSQTTIAGNVTPSGLFLASDGNDFLAVWADYSDNKVVRAARINSLDGTQMGTTLDVFGVLDNTLYGSPYPRVAFGNSQYTILAVNGRQIVGQRFGADLTPIDTSAFVVASLSSKTVTTSQTGLAIATNTHGRSLVLFVDAASERSSYAIKGRFLDGGDSCGDVGGTGGIGGGTGGASGTGGTGGLGAGGVSSTGGVFSTGGTGGLSGTGGISSTGGTGGLDAGATSDGGVGGAIGTGGATTLGGIDAGLGETGYGAGGAGAVTGTGGLASGGGGGGAGGALGSGGVVAVDAAAAGGTDGGSSDAQSRAKASGGCSCSIGRGNMTGPEVFLFVGLMAALAFVRRAANRLLRAPAVERQDEALAQAFKHSRRRRRHLDDFDGTEAALIESSITRALQERRAV